MKNFCDAVGLVALLSAGCSNTTVPPEWAAFVPTEQLEEVVAGTDAVNFNGAYAADADRAALRSGLRQNAESQGFAASYSCEFPDGRMADGYLKRPESLEWTVIPGESGGSVLVMASHNTNVDRFASLPDPACQWTTP